MGVCGAAANLGFTGAATGVLPAEALAVAGLAAPGATLPAGFFTAAAVAPPTLEPPAEEAVVLEGAVPARLVRPLATPAAARLLMRLLVPFAPNRPGRRCAAPASSPSPAALDVTELASLSWRRVDDSVVGRTGAGFVDAGVVRVAPGAVERTVGFAVDDEEEGVVRVAEAARRGATGCGRPRRGVLLSSGFEAMVLSF